MSRPKLQKFAELKTFPNVFQCFDQRRPALIGSTGAEVSFRGRWAAGHFANANPITLELACGRGEYALGLARRLADRNFIGMDIKGARIWKGAKTALEESLSNVVFVRIQIGHLAAVFGPGEIDEIWITFPDPYLKNSKTRKRLTSPKFLAAYRNVLREGGVINLKTDSPELFDFTLSTIAAEGHHLLERIDDVYAAGDLPEELRISTYYERMHLAEGRVIRYLRFGLA